MKNKTIFLTILIFALRFSSAQITPSMTIPYPLPEYNGTYEDFGTNHLFYPNDGEIRFANADQTDAKSTVKFYTMNTYPKKYLLRDNTLSYLHYKTKPTTTSGGADSLQRIDIKWQNGNAGAFLARVDTQNFAKLNYFTQWFSSSGRTDVKGGAAIACQSIYPNIDLVYTSNNSGLVMFFIVYPGGNYKNIQMNVAGAKATSIVSNKLKIDANWESSGFEKPQMYQYTYVSGIVTPVNIANASWSSIGSNKYEFTTTSSFSSSLPLIIQVKQANATQFDTPGLDWSTYFGGSARDFLVRTHTDANNSIYAAGYSESPAIGFPQGPGVTTNPNGIGDGTIAKFDNIGILQWTTFVGGSGFDMFHDFAINGTSIYCVGKCASNNMPVVSKVGATNDNTFGGGNWDAFICELSFNPLVPAVQNNWLTYVGGNGNEEYNACKFDGSGNLFCVGAGSSTNMTVAGTGLGAYTQTFTVSQLTVNPSSTDGIIASYNSSGLQTWFTFYGTSSLGANAYNHAGDHLYDLAINGTDLYVCGEAGGTNLPNSYNTKTNSNYYGGILAHFNTSGQAFTNGASWTSGNACNNAVEIYGGDVFLAGTTFTGMTTVNSGLYYYDATLSGASDASFIVYNNGAVQHCSYFGGNTNDSGMDIAFTSNGLILLAGGTTSGTFPNTSFANMYYATITPIQGWYSTDHYIAAFQKFSTNITWCSNLGSNQYESNYLSTAYDNDFGLATTAIALDSQNNLYVAGCSDSPNNYPLDEWYSGISYFQPLNNSVSDGTMTRILVTDLNAIVGIEDFKNTKFVIGVYPNPTSKYLAISDNELSAENLQYIIYDANGKKLMVGKLAGNEGKNIDVSSLPPGMYIINVSNGDKTYHNKFIKSAN